MRQKVNYRQQTEATHLFYLLKKKVMRKVACFGILMTNETT